MSKERTVKNSLKFISLININDSIGTLSVLIRHTLAVNHSSGNFEVNF